MLALKKAQNIDYVKEGNGPRIKGSFHFVYISTVIPRYTVPRYSDFPRYRKINWF